MATVSTGLRFSLTTLEVILPTWEDAKALNGIPILILQEICLGLGINLLPTSTASLIMRAPFPLKVGKIRQSGSCSYHQPSDFECLIRLFPPMLKAKSLTGSFTNAAISPGSHGSWTSWWGLCTSDMLHSKSTATNHFTWYPIILKSVYILTATAHCLSNIFQIFSLSTSHQLF